jgi:hypothetical protein
MDGGNGTDNPASHGSRRCRKRGDPPEAPTDRVDSGRSAVSIGPKADGGMSAVVQIIDGLDAVEEIIKKHPRTFKLIDKILR